MARAFIKSRSERFEIPDELFNESRSNTESWSEDDSEN